MLKGKTFHSLPFLNHPIDEKLQRTIPSVESSKGPLKCAQQSLLKGMQISGCANPDIPEVARTEGAGCQSPSTAQQGNFHFSKSCGASLEYIPPSFQLGQLL